MSSILLIKRSETTAIPGSLANGELAWSGNSKVLYIGANDAVEAIGGRRYPGVLTANQAITTNSTGMIDVLRVGNSTVNVVANSLSITFANSTASFSLVKPSAAQISSADYYPASDGTWKQVTPGAPSTTLNDLTDVVISTATNNQILIYDEGVSQWENHSFGNGFAFDAQSPYILALNGIVANATGIHAVAANGITVTSAGINLSPGTNGGLVANSTGAWVLVANGISRTAAGLNVTAGTNGGLVSNATGVWVAASNGITLTATGTNVLGANGITVTSDGVNVLAPATGGLISNSTGVHVVPGTNGGLVANSTGLWVLVANGINRTAAGLNVTAGTGGGLVSNSTGVFVTAGTNMVTNATGVHLNPNITVSNVVTTDITVSGNLTVQGTMVIVDATNMAVNDSIISLARNNGADSLDIGVYGQYNDGTERFTGLIWDTSADVYELFANTTVEPTTTVDTAGTGYVRATLRSYLNTGALISNSIAVTITANSTVAVNMVANTLSLTTALPGSSGGTGYLTYTAEDILIANTSNGFRKLSVSATDGAVLMSNGTAIVYNNVLDAGTF